jgi:hypothetical protein
MKIFFISTIFAIIAAIQSKELVEVFRQYNLIDFFPGTIVNKTFTPINILPLDVAVDYRGKFLFAIKYFKHF